MTTKTAHKTIDEPARTPLKELVLEPMPLTGKMKSDVKAVKEAYGTFWDNIKFRKGWEKVCSQCHVNASRCLLCSCPFVLVSFALRDLCDILSFHSELSEF